MIGPLAQSAAPTVDVELYQTLIALVVVAALAVATLAVYYRAAFEDLSDDQVRQKRHLLGQRESQTPETYRIAGLDALDSAATRQALRGLFDGEATTDNEPVPTIRAGLAAARRELRGVLSSRTDRFPRLSVVFAEEAFALVAVGALATVSIDTYRRLFALGDGDLSLPAVVEAVQSSVAWFGETALSALGTFPYAEVVWALSFAYSLRLAEWLFYQPWISAAVLVMLAVTVGLLERRVPAAIDADSIDRRSLALRVGGAVVVVWLAGAVPAAAFGAVGLSAVGGVVGLLAALVVAGWLGYQATLTARHRLRELAAIVEGHRPTIQAYVVVRRLSLAVASVLVPFIPIYAVYVLASGRLLALAEAFVAGSDTVQLVVGMAVVGGVAAVALKARASWPEIRAGIEETTSRRAIRVALLARGFPVGTAIVVGLLAVSFQAPTALAVVVGLLAGLIVRLAVAVASRARRQAYLYERPSFAASRVIIHAYTLETADGEPRYYAEVNTIPVAHEDPDALVDSICAVSRELFTDGEADTHVERRFAQDLFEFGIVEIDETRRKLSEQARLVTDREFRGRQLIDAEALESTLDDELPASVWRPHLARRLRRAELVRRDGHYAVR